MNNTILACEDLVLSLNDTLQTCIQNNTVLTASTVNPCVPDGFAIYDLSLHIAAIFVVLISSFTGAAFPIFMKYQPGLNFDPYYICVGKCMGIGVILACSLVHMLQPASASLVSPCLPWEFNTDYTAYAFLYCMLAILAMHMFDYALEQYMLRQIKPLKYDFTETEIKNDNGEPIKPPKDVKVENPIELEHGHVHSVLLIEGVQKTISAYLLEFGVTVHSVFIGLENGIVGQQELRSLLVALCFHQLFEGIALGSRIADASLPSHWHEFLLSLVFSIAAPIGIAVGVAVTTSLNPSGETFLMVEGTFDSICAGILLYIGLLLLLRDFPEDMKKHCGDNQYKRFGMFLGLYVGAGLMAFIGKYL